MLTEFIGLPGSGKTTFLNEKQESFITRETINNHKISKIKEFLFYFKNWKITFLFCIGVLYNFDLNIKKWYALILGVKKTFKQYAFIEELNVKEEKIILDEGLLQRALSVFCFKRKKINFYLLNKTVKQIENRKIIDYVYCFNIPIDKSIKRCSKRKNGLPYRFKGISEEVLKIKLSLFQKGILLIKEKGGFNIEELK